jgi:hypothetical protein
MGDSAARNRQRHQPVSVMCVAGSSDLRCNQPLACMYYVAQSDF